MGIEHVEAEHAQIDKAASKTTLHLEMRSSERHVLASFRELFMRWVNDRGASGFAHEAGVPQRISFEEGESESDAGLAAVLNLDLVWTLRHGSSVKPGTQLQTTASPTATLPSRPRMDPHQKFVFFPDPDSEIPRHEGAALFNGAALEQLASRAEWARATRPPVLDLMYTGVRIAARTYRSLRSRDAGGTKGPSRAVAASRRLRGSFTSASVRVLLPRSPIRSSQPWFAAVRTMSLYAAVGLATLVLVVAAYKSRTSDVLAADQAARADLQRSRQLPPRTIPDALGPSPVSGTTPLTADSAKEIEAIPLSATAASQVESKVATKGAAAPALLATDAPRSAASPSGRAVPPTMTIAPVTMVAESEAVGTLVVASEPSGAEVTINGVTHGYTPLKIEKLSVGTRVVRLDLPGYARWSWAVNVVANKRTPVTVKLQPETRRIGASN